MIEDVRSLVVCGANICKISTLIVHPWRIRICSIRTYAAIIMVEGQSAASEHLIVVCHGMWGSPRDVAYLANTLSSNVPHSIVLVSKVRQTHLLTTLPCIGSHLLLNRSTHSFEHIMASMCVASAWPWKSKLFLLNIHRSNASRSLVGPAHVLTSLSFVTSSFAQSPFPSTLCDTHKNRLQCRRTLRPLRSGALTTRRLFRQDRTLGLYHSRYSSPWLSRSTRDRLWPCKEWLLGRRFQLLLR